MTKTTFYLAGMVLAVTFFAAVQTQAEEFSPYEFDFRRSSYFKYNLDLYQGVEDNLALTATDNKNGGIDFVLSSTYTNKNDRPGILLSNGVDWIATSSQIDLSKNYVSLFHWESVFKSPDRLIINLSAGRLERTSGFVLKDDKYETTFTLQYRSNKGWEQFLGLIKNDDPATAANEAMNGFYVVISLGELNGSRDEYSFATFDTAMTQLGQSRDAGAAVPEPATLAVFGLGLSGLGLFCRKRRK